MSEWLNRRLDHVECKLQVHHKDSRYIQSNPLSAVVKLQREMLGRDRLARRRRVQETLRQQDDGKRRNPLFDEHEESKKQWDAWFFRPMYEQVVVYTMVPTTGTSFTNLSLDQQISAVLERTRCALAHHVQYIKLSTILLMVTTALAMNGMTSQGRSVR